MKIIVDPDFPNPQLFVDIIHQVADRYMDRLIHKSIIAGKLATAEIHLHLRVPSEEECTLFEKRKAKMLAMRDSLPKIIYERVLTETVYDSLQIKGTHQVCFENNRVFSKIDLDALPYGCLREFAELVAHEMTHMLVCNSHNYFNLCTSVECGSVPVGSSLYRWNPDRKVEYGHKMEEIAVYTAGVWLVKDMPLPADQKNEELYYPMDPIAAELCNLMANAFGTPLNELHFLDEFSHTEDRLNVPNIFWYAFAVNQFGYIIQIFNEVMGDDAYERLSEYLDEYFDEITEQGYEKIREMLQDFSQKMKESE